MKELNIVLKFIAIIFIIFIILLITKYIIFLKRKNRLKDFSININQSSNNNKTIYNIIFTISNILESLVIFNTYSRTYETYIDEKSNLKKGMDYISIKLITGIIFIIFYLLISFIYQEMINVTLILLTFIIGYLIPDFYCIYTFGKKNILTNNQVISSIIIMSNSYKANRSTEQAINDVISRSDGRINKEFKRVLSDIKLGMSSGEAFKKMYERTKNKYILEISNYLASLSLSNISAREVFASLELKLLKEEKINNSIDYYKDIIDLTYRIFIILPLLFLIYIIFFKFNLKVILSSSIGDIIIIILLILYLLYCLLIRYIAKGDKNE